MNDSNNSVIYLEVDEDITSAIDKLSKAEGKTIEVVSAKRSTLFQSVINLKLLKKAAADSKKGLVLVTADRVVTNLAGRLGVPIASQVGEAAQIPVVGAAAVTAAAVAAASEDEIDGGTVGDAAGKSTEARSSKPSSESPSPTSKPAASPLETPQQPEEPSNAAAAKPKKAKKSLVPNIGKMQKRLLWGGAALLIIILLFVGNYFITKAKVTLFANASQVNASFTFTADPNAQSSDVASGILSAEQLSVNKSLDASVQATGTKDNGTKASGTMTVSNCTTNSQTLVAGTRFVAGDGHVFRSTSDANLPPASFPVGSCVPVKTSVGVNADANGDGYNLGPGDYSIPGLNNPAVTARGGQMQGGTTKTVKVLTQADVDKAKQAALDADKAAGIASLKKKANKEQQLLEASVEQKVTGTDSNPDVGAEAQTASLSIQVTYTGLAVQTSALSDLAKQEEAKQLGAQSEIYDDGSGNLQLAVTGKSTADGAKKFSAKATAYSGEKIDKTELASKLKGKKYSEAVDIASRTSGVEKAEVKLSPGWASSVPHVQKHIQVDVKVLGVGD